MLDSRIELNWHQKQRNFQDQSFKHFFSLPLPVTVASPGLKPLTLGLLGESHTAVPPIIYKFNLYF